MVMAPAQWPNCQSTGAFRSEAHAQKVLKVRYATLQPQSGNSQPLDIIVQKAFRCAASLLPEIEGVDAHNRVRNIVILSLLLMGDIPWAFASASTPSA